MTKTCKRCQRDIESKAKTCPYCHADQRNWLAKNKLLGSLAVLLVLFTVVNLSVSQLPISQVLRNDVQCANVASQNVSQKLQCLISGVVGTDSSVKNIELAVTTGDGSYSWVGAAGIANQQGHIPMAKYLPADLIRGIDVYQGKDYSNVVTIRELVSMTSGIPDYRSWWSVLVVPAALSLGTLLGNSFLEGSLPNIADPGFVEGITLFVSLGVMPMAIGAAIGAPLGKQIERLLRQRIPAITVVH